MFCILICRWLSLGKAVNRLLEFWDPLLEFFKDESDAQQKGGKRKVSPNSSLPVAKKSKVSSSSGCNMNTAMKRKGPPNSNPPAAKKTKHFPSSSGSSVLNTTRNVPPNSNPAGKKGKVIPSTSGSSVLNTGTAMKRKVPPNSTPPAAKKEKVTPSISGNTVNTEKSKRPIASTSSSSTSVVPASAANPEQKKKSSTKEFDINKYFFNQQELSRKKTAVRKSGKTTSTCKVSTPPEPTEQNVHKFTLIYQRLNDPNCRLYALFLKSSLPIFDHSNEVGLLDWKFVILFIYNHRP